MMEDATLWFKGSEFEKSGSFQTKQKKDDLEEWGVVLDLLKSSNKTYNVGLASYPEYEEYQRKRQQACTVPIKCKKQESSTLPST